MGSYFGGGFHQGQQSAYADQLDGGGASYFSNDQDQHHIQHNTHQIAQQTPLSTSSDAIVENQQPTNQNTLNSGEQTTPANSEANNLKPDDRTSVVPLKEFGGLPASVGPTISPLHSGWTNYHAQVPINLNPYQYSSYPLIYDQVNPYQAHDFLPPYGYYYPEISSFGEHNLGKVTGENSGLSGQNPQVSNSNGLKHDNNGQEHVNNGKNNDLSNQNQANNQQDDMSPGDGAQHGGQVQPNNIQQATNPQQADANSNNVNHKQHDSSYGIDKEQGQNRVLGNYDQQQSINANNKQQQNPSSQISSSSTLGAADVDMSKIRNYKPIDSSIHDVPAPPVPHGAKIDQQ